ncbi:unnamed protein product [Protopolystoma xenopodis]|uniref:Uncharacterized protein n=1 Tax=Protopolystoma xenopodis TaxID=117903 RepID=A0A448WG41_9PLAT|nr:unnamed protein product [Protopolystoma xenopodis]
MVGRPLCRSAPWHQSSGQLYFHKTDSAPPDCLAVPPALSRAGRPEEMGSRSRALSAAISNPTPRLGEPHDTPTELVGVVGVVGPSGISSNQPHRSSLPKAARPGKWAECTHTHTHTPCSRAPTHRDPKHTHVRLHFHVGSASLWSALKPAEGMRLGCGTSGLGQVGGERKAEG